jgi:hypothetical protein
MAYWQQGYELYGGKFIVEQLLGFGGFGDTYKVREAHSNKPVNRERELAIDFNQWQSSGALTWARRRFAPQPLANQGILIPCIPYLSFCERRPSALPKG